MKTSMHNHDIGNAIIGISGTLVTAGFGFLATLAPWQENISWTLSLMVGFTTLFVLIFRNKKS